MSDWRYTYGATVDRVIDGDTVVLLVDLGFHIQAKETFRLHGLNAPEVRGAEREEGLRSEAWLIGQLSGLTHIQTLKDKMGKYGRYLVELFDGDGSINQRMIAEGFAEAREY